MPLMCIASMIKCISSPGSLSLAKAWIEGRKKRGGGGANKEEWEKQTRETEKKKRNERKKSQGRGGEGGGRKTEKHSACKLQIKSISALHNKPPPRGRAGTSAPHSVQIGRRS